MRIKKACMAIALASMMVLAGGCGSQAKQESTTGGTNAGAESTELLIAAAASLEYSMEEKLIPLFEEQNSGVDVKGVYDSSGKLQTQNEEGLEADVFFSAATKQMDALVEEGYVNKDDVVSLLENQLVLIVPKDSDKGIQKFEDITKGTTIAIGDPESVPVGQYAKEALTTLNLWDQIQDKVSLGTNVTEVLNWVAEGSTDVGIVYATDAATTDNVTVVGYAPEGALAEPVIYPVSTLKNSKQAEVANKFVEFLQSSEAKAILEDYGFTPVEK